MTCSNCGAANSAGRKFCGECGSSLAVACANCGAANEPGMRFCGECGSSLAAGTQGPPVAAPVAPAAAERRLVSVLFADLVGFTAMSESRDAEEVRELLTRYFDTCRRLIGRYGGTIEKFIGDAVMAVWGAPVAQEDDAERAVRAALDLVDAIAALGNEVGVPDLRARAGVLTGEAAVSVGAEGQGMVAGDLVNTASRVQSAAEPGRVLVGESTRRATEAAVVYEDAGLHEMKGKAEPVQLWAASRVVAGVGGALKSQGLEAPFVGRDRELRLVKELFHASADGGRAQLLSVTGVAGVGKSRMGWEFYKYMDGLKELFRWHRGRCLAYGEGVAYWALAEMVRGRAGIVEAEEGSAALAKLRACVEEHVVDPDERRWVEPRLAHLIGLEEGTAGDREDLFAAWRLFFERIAEGRPVIMAFEDVQWADSALLDFIEYLLEWSKGHPIFILSLARPEVLERRPGWGTGRSATSLSLDPLSRDHMEKLLAGLVPGLPAELRDRILERAEGIPLYAVETVRMLLDRGLLTQEGNRYQPTGPIESLEVPETLQALIAARIDGLSAEESRVVRDASVLGKTFTRPALATLSGLPVADLDSLLTGLVRKEVLGVQADPRSPERGQYGFLQDVVRKVAYDMLSKKERKARHLAAAAYLEQTWGSDEEEIVEVVASHYVQAFDAAPDAPDADEIKSKARDGLVHAGRRAASLAASGEARRYFEQAIDLEDDPAAGADLHERAGEMAWLGGHHQAATEHLERAIHLFEATGGTHPAARVSARLGEVLYSAGKTEEAVSRMEEAYAVMATDEPDEDLAVLLHQLGRLHFFLGHDDEGLRWVTQALDVAETLWIPEVISQALNTKALMMKGPEEGLALLRHALRVAEENDLSQATVRAMYNLADRLQTRDRYDEALDLYRRGMALARRLGNRPWEWRFQAELAYQLVLVGEWEEAEGLIDPDAASDVGSSWLLALPDLQVARGQVTDARALVDGMEDLSNSNEPQPRAGFATALSAVLAGEGRFDEALAAAEEALEVMGSYSVIHQLAKVAWVEALEAAVGAGDLERLEDLLRRMDLLPPVAFVPSLEAHRARFRSRLAAARGDVGSVEPGFKSAAGLFRELGTPFWLAVTELEHGEWLAGQGRSAVAEPFLVEAGEIFERLRAAPYLARVETALGRSVGERVGGGVER